MGLGLGLGLGLELGLGLGLGLGQTIIFDIIYGIAGFLYGIAGILLKPNLNQEGRSPWHAAMILPLWPS